MVKVKPNGHIWDSSSIDMFAFRFVAIQPYLAAIQQIPYLTLKIQGQGHDENQSKSNQVMTYL